MKDLLLGTLFAMGLLASLGSMWKMWKAPEPKNIKKRTWAREVFFALLFFYLVIKHFTQYLAD